MCEKEIDGYEYLVRNIVIKATSSSHIDINEAIKKLGHGVYSDFSAIVTRFTDPKVSVNIFSTGKMMVLGSKTINGALYVLLKLKEALNINFVNIELCNIVVTMKLGYKLNLAELYNENRSTCQYDPVLFPSMIYHMPNCSMTASIFSEGNIQVYGCKSLEEIESIMKSIINDIILKNRTSKKIKTETFS